MGKIIYDFHAIINKRNERWAKKEIYRIFNESTKPKYYVLDMFPYPSGAGLHVGHPLGYIASDIHARFKRMSGYNVLHPMGFDSFGLPAEQYAIKNNTHPAISTQENIDYFKSQLLNLGLSYDWSREVQTNSPDYYKRTQWIFLKLYNHYYDIDANKACPIDDLIKQFETNGTKEVNAASSENLSFDAVQWMSFTPKEKSDILMNYRLAFRNKAFVNWCEELGTVLANDEVINGLSERGGHPVELKEIEQWSMRITAYIDRLLTDLNELEWSESLKLMQKNWIGKSTGAEIEFRLEQNQDHILKVFTTRPDTIFGTTFIVFSPERYKEFVSQGVFPKDNQVERYLAKIQHKSELERKVGDKVMNGVNINLNAVNPFNNQKIPIRVSDYVLDNYGTGIIIGVPSEDERDEKFAKTFNLPIVEIIDRKNPKQEVMCNSNFLDGLDIKSAQEKVLKVLVEKGIGNSQTCSKMRDANFSRQRYRGEPIPVEYDADGISCPLDESQLPLLLPKLASFNTRDGINSPLGQLTDRVNHNGKIREIDTMPGYAGSSWYYLRYMDAKNNEVFASKEAIDYWKDVDLYIGGTEHAVGHLLYARFWHKFLHDLGYVPTKEPFKKLYNQGMIQGVIEYIYVSKDYVDGKKQVVSEHQIKDFNNYLKIPIYIGCVKEYGLKSSYLDKNSIKSLADRRKEFTNYTFIGDDGNPLDEGGKLTTTSETGKMGKRYHNSVNPNDIVDKYGPDCLRLYLMFLGPLDQSKPWSISNISGVSKFLNKFWNLCVDNKLTSDDPTLDEKVTINECLTKISKDIEELSLNTSVSQFMISVNKLKALNCNNKIILEKLVRALAPFAPYICEEIWERFGYKSSIHHTEFPKPFNIEIQQKEYLYPISINGKKRAEILMPLDITEDEIVLLCKHNEKINKSLEWKEIKKVIFVPGKIVNFVL